MQEFRMRFYRLLASVWICIVPVLACAQDGPAPPSNGAAVSIVRDKVIVPVFVNGAGPYPFVLDIGIEHTVISSAIAATSRTDGAAPASPQNSSSDIEVGELRCGEAVSKPLRALVMDLAPFKAILGTDVAGIFNGREFGGRIDINIPAETVEFLPGAGNTPGDTDSKSVRFRQDEHGQPTVSALIDGKHVRSFIVDTTFAGIVAMPEQSLRDLGLFSRPVPGAGDIPSLRIDPAPVGAPDPSPPAPESMQIRLKSIRVGGVEIADPVCSVLSAEEPARVGLGFLRNLKVTFDFEAKYLRLEHKGPSPIACAPVLGYGIVPACFADGYWTVWVVKDSPAAKANVRSGARLIEIAGTDLRDAAYTTVAERLTANEGGTQSVTVLQEGEKRTVALAVQPLL